MILKTLIYFVNDLIEKGIYCHIVKMWDLSQNDGPIANVLMHSIIYSIIYGKKSVCIRIDCAGLYIYFGIKATVKLLEKNGCYRCRTHVC